MNNFPYLNQQKKKINLFAIVGLFVVSALFYSGWMTYQILWNDHSGTVIRYQHETLRKDAATVTEKIESGAQYSLVLSYRKGKEKALLPVSFAQFNKASIDDQLPIFYNVQETRRWYSLKDQGFFWNLGSRFFVAIGIELLVLLFTLTRIPFYQKRLRGTIHRLISGGPQPSDALTRH